MPPKLLGTSTVSKGFKTTIIKRVAEKLDLNEGDLIAYYEGENGDIIIRKP
jgi:bifunctional DNA-binding transcriptional regulator/antitoxin component of YhaV-PrlF toxin-antitoxin module